MEWLHLDLLFDFFCLSLLFFLMAVNKGIDFFFFFVK